MMVAVAVNFGAVLGVIGWNVGQALGWIAEPAVEAAQREQAAAISQLDANVVALNSAMEGLIARADSAGEREVATTRRVDEMEIAVGGLRSSISDMRAAQTLAAQDPAADLTGSVVRPRAGDASAPELTAIGARIERIERAMAQHNLLGPMRGSIQEPGTRALALRARPPAGDGHIISLPPSP
jgi:hypothetical protein